MTVKTKICSYKVVVYFCLRFKISNTIQETLNIQQLKHFNINEKQTLNSGLVNVTQIIIH